MRSRPFPAPRCGCGGAASFALAPYVPPNSPGSDREIRCNTLRSDLVENRASTDGNSGGQDQGADQSAAFPRRQSELTPRAQSTHPVPPGSECAAIPCGQSPHFAVTANRGRGEIPGSSACASGVFSVYWCDAGAASIDAIRKLGRRATVSAVRPKRFFLIPLSRSGLTPQLCYLVGWPPF